MYQKFARNVLLCSGKRQMTLCPASSRLWWERKVTGVKDWLEGCFHADRERTYFRTLCEWTLCNASPSSMSTSLDRYNWRKTIATAPVYVDPRVNVTDEFYQRRCVHGAFPKPDYVLMSKTYKYARKQRRKRKGMSFIMLRSHTPTVGCSGNTNPIRKGKEH